MIDILRLIEIAAATWYVAFAVTNTHGPGGIFEWIREHVYHGRYGAPTYGRWTAPDGTVHETEKQYPANGLLDCIICFAPYVALLFLIVPDGVIIQALAIAGAALMLHGFTGWRVDF